MADKSCLTDYRLHFADPLDHTLRRLQAAEAVGAVAGHLIAHPALGPGPGPVRVQVLDPSLARPPVLDPGRDLYHPKAGAEASAAIEMIRAGTDVITACRLSRREDVLLDEATVGA